MKGPLLPDSTPGVYAIMKPRFRRWFLAGLTVCVLANAATAATITFGGLITQSPTDGGILAVNNPTLNAIMDGQAYTVTLIFPGSIAMPSAVAKLYDFTGSSLKFNDSVAMASEMSFASIKLSVVLNAGFDELSLLGCLTSGTDCGSGNQLSANFKIPDGMLNSQNVAAMGLDQPHPLDLLEDDSVTDIHGTITSYSFSGPTSAVPEPSAAVLLGVALAGLIAANRITKKEKKV